MSRKMSTVKTVLQAIEARYPLARAAGWDKVGLQIGDETAPVSKVLVAHEITEKVLDEAASHRSQAVVVYHPLIFRPLETLNFRDHTARLAARAIAQNLNIIAVHTALDHAAHPHALGDALAATLGLEQVEVLRPDGFEALNKLVVFVPLESLEAVQNAMWEAGAGEIGEYDCASFRTHGQGTFRPGESADPYSGKIGVLETVEEWRLEIIVPQAGTAQVIRAMKEAHPYEEVAYDLFKLENKEAGQAYGAARCGTLPQSTSLLDYADSVSKVLGAPGVRVVEANSKIQKVACVPGSGASFIQAAAQAGCDCLVTGDIKHHDALQAKALGVSLIDVTHAATERATIPMMAEALSVLEETEIEIKRSQVETNPFASA